MMGPFATTPLPPYYAVIFASQRQGADDDYGITADRMVELAATQPGYLGIESCRDAQGFGITVSYWRNEGDIRTWKRNTEHALARERGRTGWYAHFELRVARVERAYGGPRDPAPGGSPSGSASDGAPDIVDLA
jgi:heme-degrading monooxygenase HmoA